MARKLACNLLGAAACSVSWGGRIRVRFHWGSGMGRTGPGRIGKCSSEIDTHLLVKCVGVGLTAGVGEDRVLDSRFWL